MRRPARGGELLALQDEHGQIVRDARVADVLIDGAEHGG
jgi:hypothetical protein